MQLTMLSRLHSVPLYTIFFFVLLVSSLFCFSSSQELPSGISYYLSQNSASDFPRSSRSVSAGNRYYDDQNNGFSTFSNEGLLANNLKYFINVEDFGAQGDGSDDTKAFEMAWKKACSSSNGVFLVPGNKAYYLKPITFSGPCKSGLQIKIQGMLLASKDPSDYSKNSREWLVFKNIQNMLVEGGGTIDGNGKTWWERSCKVNEDLPCHGAPTALTFIECKNLLVRNLEIKNAQQMHLSFQDCENVQASKLIVKSPGYSPNTDGIHVTGTKNIRIVTSIIKTGDDCISIVSGSKNVQVYDIRCGPGHGISIGSLGKDGSEAEVSNVLVRGVIFSGTTNGVRIKTWQGGLGYAKNIQFQNIRMRNVSNPIIIDQNYCDQKSPCHEQGSAVQVKNVVFKNIIGTSASKVALKFDCSKALPCEDIILDNINLKDYEDGNTEGLCSNVGLSTLGSVFPHCS